LLQQVMERLQQVRCWWQALLGPPQHCLLQQVMERLQQVLCWLQGMVRPEQLRQVHQQVMVKAPVWHQLQQVMARSLFWCLGTRMMEILRLQRCYIQVVVWALG
jgi:hypothetical protein